jgi:hypothetical protein
LGLTNRLATEWTLSGKLNTCLNTVEVKFMRALETTKNTIQLAKANVAKFLGISGRAWNATKLTEDAGSVNLREALRSSVFDNLSRL